MRSSHGGSKAGLCALMVAVALVGAAAAERPTALWIQVSPAAVAPPARAASAVELDDRPASVDEPSSGGVAELAFAESCEEGENGLCPVTSFDFGTVATGSSSTYPGLWLVNQSVSVPATGLSFQSGVEFPLLPLFGGCHNPGLELLPGEFCQVSVKFAPTIPGPAIGTLTAASAEGSEATLPLTGTGGSDVVLHGQFHDWDTMPSFFAMRNARYTSTPDSSAELADDFLVEDPDGWTIKVVGLEVLRFPSLGNPLPVDVQIAPDEDGIPGDVAICSSPDSKVVLWEEPFNESRVEIALNSPCTLPPGHYWLRVRPTAGSHFEDGFIFWGMQYLSGDEENPPGKPPIHLNPLVWRNPGNDGDHGCTSWTRLYPPACGLEDFWPFLVAYDAVFWLIGQVGEVPSPVLAFDPASLDFGDVAVGSSETLDAILWNSGDAAATGLTFSGLPSDFAADTSACGTSLDAGEGCAVAVTFTPLSSGPMSAQLQVTSAELAFASTSLTGNGVPPAFGFTPMSIEVDRDPFFTDGNGVLEPGEVVEVSPAWRNGGSATVSLAGTASGFNGPQGANYALLLRDADYGLVEGGQTASCLEQTGICYWLGVNAPAGRPAVHWEASFDETLSDGPTKTWTLHIGDSFADVPRASPFYRSIETLLHHGVTGGCTATEYCPAGANTRGQMAVFLLKAAEGAAYGPPACVEGEEWFDDVPFDSSLCPWIEELAARGVTSGCGGGNYCPASPVTRAQMAVFLLKAFEGEGYTPPECTGEFSDVACPSTFAAWVEELAGRGISGGCSADPPAYCPAAPVTRQQMAVFVTKTFGLTLYGP